MTSENEIKQQVVEANRKFYSNIEFIEKWGGDENGKDYL